MDKYTILEELGAGSFAQVFKAKAVASDELVAIKKMKKLYNSWDDCLQLRELKSLRKIKHTNIILLKEVIREPDKTLYFVFEYMRSNLYSLMDQKQTFTAAEIKSVMFQLLSALAHMHKFGFFHRDIKPENVLLDEDGCSIKLADLGLAREIRSCPPFTEYVSTRWYRSPECLLQSTTYNSPIDLWACGCIMAELYNGRVLFKGSSELDQLCEIGKILGSPNSNNWQEGMQLLSKMQFNFPKANAVKWETVVPSADQQAISLLSDLLQYDSHRRPTAAQALNHAFFQDLDAKRLPTLKSFEKSQTNVNVLPKTLQTVHCASERTASEPAIKNGNIVRSRKQTSNASFYGTMPISEMSIDDIMNMGSDTTESKETTQTATKGEMLDDLINDVMH